MPTTRPTTPNRETDPKDTTVTPTAWTGMLPIDDTALAVTDSGGTGPTLVYLNGAYASQRHWRPTIEALGDGWRHITYDERARGKSKRSTDYTFAAMLRDVDAVLKARNVTRPILVGWSYGAFLAVEFAVRNPDRVAGVVAVDGALPFGLSGEAGRQRIRKMFRRMAPLLPLVRPFGLAAKMSADEHAEVNIECNEIAANFEPVLQRVAVPLRYVVATGDSLGAKDGEHEQARAALAPVLDRNPYVKVSAKATSDHGAILRKDAAAVAATIREVAALDTDR